MRDGDDLARLDAALLDLRRFIEAPTGTSGDPDLSHRDSRVELSTVLVVDAVARSDPARDCTIGRVADALHVAHSTASRLVDRAQRAGMVRSGRSATDPRRSVVALTPAGRRLQRDAVGYRTGRLAGLLADWPAADVAAFAGLLERFARSTHAHPPVAERT